MFWIYTETRTKKKFNTINYLKKKTAIQMEFSFIFSRWYLKTVFKRCFHSIVCLKQNKLSCRRQMHFVETTRKSLYTQNDKKLDGFSHNLHFPEQRWDLFLLFKHEFELNFSWFFHLRRMNDFTHTHTLIYLIRENVMWECQSISLWTKKKCFFFCFFILLSNNLVLFHLNGIDYIIDSEWFCLEMPSNAHTNMAIQFLGRGAEKTRRTWNNPCGE